MSARQTVVITTRLPPQICGVGACSWMAYKHRPADSPQASFLVMEGAAQSRPTLGWEAINDFLGDPLQLERSLDLAGPANVLVHYAGRAYQRFGCPTWMPRVLAKWKAKFPEGRLTIFFHEAPGKLPRWSRHSILAKVGGRIIRQLAGVADALVTNTENHVAILRQLSGRNDIHLIPIGSNIEPVSNSSPSRAPTEFIIFGLPFGRRQTLQLFDSKIHDWQASGHLDTIHLIGPEDPRFSQSTKDLIHQWPKPEAAVPHGSLPDSDVARLFARAQFALTNVTSETWSKSGVFMTCAATGCAPVIAQEGAQDIPLSFAIAAAEVAGISGEELASRAASLKGWYEHNADWTVIAKQLAALVEGKQSTA